jgi:hypothetical protein
LQQTNQQPDDAEAEHEDGAAGHFEERASIHKCSLSFPAFDFGLRT